MGRYRVASLVWVLNMTMFKSKSKETETPSGAYMRLIVEAGGIAAKHGELNRLHSILADTLRQYIKDMSPKTGGRLTIRVNGIEVAHWLYEDISRFPTVTVDNTLRQYIKDMSPKTGGRLTIRVNGIEVAHWLYEDISRFPTVTVDNEPCNPGGVGLQ